MQLAWLKPAGRIVAGLVFLISAIFKFRSIDSFELYLFSLDWFPLVVCFYFARILIVAELVLGLALASFVWTKWVNIASYVILGVFSLFLVYLVAIGYDGSCHCMGEVIDLPPIPSLLKNAVLFLLIVLSARCTIKVPYVQRVLPVLSFVLLVAIFVVSPPDGIREPKPAVVHQTGVDRFFSSDSVFQTQFVPQPKVMVCLFSTGCQVCKLSARKMQLMVNKYNIPADRVYTLYHGQPADRLRFLEVAQVTSDFPYKMLSPEEFGLMVGQVPVFLIFEKGKLTQKYTYRSLTEDVVSQLVY